jgi:hypothetical protein
MRKTEVLISVKREVLNTPAAEKKPYIEIAVLFAAVQLAIVICLYLIGHGAAHTRVSDIGAQSGWYFAEPSMMISNGAFICVNKFFEHIETIWWWFLAISLALVLFIALAIWGVSEPKKFDSIHRWMQSIGTRLQQWNISVRSWSALGIALYSIAFFAYAFLFLLVLFVMLWSSGAAVGRASVKEMKEHWASKANHLSSPRFITIDADDKVFCGMHVDSSPRGHIVWDGKSAMLLPLDSTSFKSSCAPAEK